MSGRTADPLRRLAPIPSNAPSGTPVDGDMIPSPNRRAGGRNVNLNDHLSMLGLTMHVLSPRARSMAMAGIAATALSVALAPVLVAMAPPLPPPAAVASGSTCVNGGVVPLNPYVVNCNLPPEGTKSPARHRMLGGRSSLAGTSRRACRLTSIIQAPWSSPDTARDVATDLT